MSIMLSIILRNVYNISIFLAHASASIYILFLVFQVDKYCAEGSNKKHYIEEYVNNAQHRYLYNDGYSSRTWPVKNERYDGSEIYQGVLQPTTGICRDITDQESQNNAVIHACAAAGLHQSFEKTPDNAIQSILGSSINILYLMLIFEWISASFALFYVDDIQESKPNPNLSRFKLTILCIVFAWDITLIILAFVMVFDDRWNVPTNNAILGMFALFKTIVVQISCTANAVSRPQNAVSETPLNSPLENSYSSAAIHYIEYAITAPILVIGVQSTIVLNSSIWPIQVCVSIFNIFDQPLCSSIKPSTFQFLRKC